MKLQEAIEIKRKYQYILQDASFLELIEADKMSIEALKRCKYLEEHTDRWAGVLLPGETED